MADRMLQTDSGDQITSSTYNSSDLKFLQGVVEDLLEEILDTGEYLFEPTNRELLKTRLSVAIFKYAEGGERDYDHLRRQVMATFLARPSPSPATP